MNTISPVDVYMASYINRTRKVTKVSSVAKAYIHKYVNRDADRVILSKPAMRIYHAEMNRSES